MAETPELTLRNSRRAAGVAVLCLLIMLVMFMIDGQRNKIMLEQVREARRILDEFRVVANVAAGGGNQPAVPADVAGTSPVGPVAGVGGGDHLVAASPAGTGSDPAGGNGAAPPMPRNAGVASRPARDG